MNVKLTKNEKVRVTGPESIFRVMRQILLRENEIERTQEHLWCVSMTHQQNILHIELVSLGSGNQAIVKPMEVFRVAVLKGAKKLALVHNHPGAVESKDLFPSQDDNDITDRMIQAGKILGIEVVDHLIISEDFFFSYHDSGLLTELKKSKKWVPKYEEEARLRKEKEQIKKEALKLGMEKGRKKGLKEGKKDMAKKLKQDGVDIKLISKASGLSKKEIENLE
jgi:DNA repair protein RadC